MVELGLELVLLPQVMVVRSWNICGEMWRAPKVRGVGMGVGAGVGTGEGWGLGVEMKMMLVLVAGIGILVKVEGWELR
jgi:hypothetical protein